MGYYLLGHGGSADHGSEDRVRGICRVLPEQPELYSAALEEDWRYGLGELAGLNQHLPGGPEGISSEDWKVLLTPALGDRLTKGDRALLWGWTPGAENLSRRMIRRLRKFHSVVVTDPESVKLLCAAGLEKTVRLGPDPSFLVKRQLRGLHGAFRKETVGLCVSPAVRRFEQRQGVLYRGYCHLIQWVLEHTDWQVALIPYCVKPGCNDELLLKVLEQRFGKTGRILRRGDGDCRVLRGDLSMCRCCVGTAGALAGWSCGVPGLCIGSSVRARNLSRMLYETADPVVSVGSLRREEDLTVRFQAFLRREDMLRQRLERSVNQYHRWAMDWAWQDAV